MLVREMDSEIGKIIDQNGHMTFIASMVFETTVCGYYEGKFITILDGRKKVLPMSIVMDGELKGRRYSVGDKIDVSSCLDSDLVVTQDTKNVDISMHTTDEYNLISSMHTQIRSALEGLKSDSKGMLPIMSILGMLSSSGDYSGLELKMYSMVAARTKLLITDLMEGREITAENIVGYGIGLTPSADDFLLGIAGMLDRFGEVMRKELLAAYIEKYLHTTTEVSGWMLRYGMRSRLYPEIVLEYLEHPYPGELRIDEFLKHGSTSGIDLLCGILCGLEILMEVQGR
ncbi:oxamate carbamoyltransferase subunit AllH family protein [Youngiibacter fragilis]|uniref:DUF2877 domain-containing protein n=1 Tax=Youngiibacter fragilis 232.1 TaxID=994573 RepID=V7IA58_9CLOT|nr:DUF2877 domain-containing protein [Youngiibacter fragilis]ETA82181.1 hypothetical protein T472_0202255 [Youngiibacter fragilis 232.1]